MRLERAVAGGGEARALPSCASKEAFDEGAASSLATLGTLVYLLWGRGLLWRVLRVFFLGCR